MKDANDGLDLSFEETHCPDDPPPANGDYRWYEAAGGIGLEAWSGGDWAYVGIIEAERIKIYFHDDRNPERAATIDAAKARLLQVSGANGKEVA